jgi:hypothetical protein
MSNHEIPPAPAAAGTHPPVPTLDSIQLRLIAEAASGTRGRPVVFAVSPRGEIRELTGERTQDVPPESFTIACFTPDTTPDQPPLVEASLQAAGAHRINLLDLPGGLGGADSVFWSQSAVEKFLVPYYASVHGARAGRAVAELLDAFAGDRRGAPYAAELDAEPLAKGDGGEVQVYALAHIPKSEYVLLGPGGEAETVVEDVAVVFRPDGDSALTALHLRDFLKRHRGRWRE